MTTNDHGPRFVYATHIKATPEQLWQALIDPSFTERYWGAALRSEWQEGSVITWEVAGVTIADPEQLVLAADEPLRLAFTCIRSPPGSGSGSGSGLRTASSQRWPPKDVPGRISRLNPSRTWQNLP